MGPSSYMPPGSGIAGGSRVGSVMGRLPGRLIRPSGRVRAAHCAPQRGSLVRPAPVAPFYELMRRAVFLDRDGTVIEDREYLRKPEDVVLLPGVEQALRIFQSTGFHVVLVSNQSGIGRGWISLREHANVHASLVERLTARNCRIDGAYYCPHAPAESCACRKPRPGMLHSASRRLDLQLRASYMIGDKASDVDAGKRAGCMTSLVCTGRGVETFSEIGAASSPDFVADDLLDAALWIRRRHRRESRDRPVV